MRRHIALLLAALPLVACQSASEEEENVDEGTGAASAASAFPIGIYDGENAVLQVTQLANGNRLFSFAHTVESTSREKQLVQGMVEVKGNATPKMTPDEVYPCTAQASYEGGNVVATGRCQGARQNFRVTLKPRSEDTLKGSFVREGITVAISKSSSKSLELAIEGAGLPTSRPEKGEWIYGGGAYRAYFGTCTVAVVVRSTDKSLVGDLNGTAKAIAIEPRGLGCGALEGLSGARFEQR